MQLQKKKLLMAVLVATGEMAVTQVKVVMVDLEDPFVFLFPKPTLISLCSMVPPSILEEEGVDRGNQGLEASLFNFILTRSLSEINFSIRYWRKGRGRWLAEYNCLGDSRWRPWAFWEGWHHGWTCPAGPRWARRDVPHRSTGRRDPLELQPHLRSESPQIPSSTSKTRWNHRARIQGSRYVYRD